MDRIQGRPIFWVLDADKVPVPVFDDEDGLAIAKFADFQASPESTVKQETVGSCFVSTRFLGMNIGGSFYMGGPAICFETMGFPTDDGDRYCERSATWAEALEAHARGVEWAKAKLT